MHACIRKRDTQHKVNGTVVNDLMSSSNCAQKWHGAWWFNQYMAAHYLNGEYLRSYHNQERGRGIYTAIFLKESIILIKSPK